MGDNLEMVFGHAHEGDGVLCTRLDAENLPCGYPRAWHADPGEAAATHLINTNQHGYQNNNRLDETYCTFTVGDVERWEPDKEPSPLAKRPQVCGYPERMHLWDEHDKRVAARAQVGSLVRKADVAQYERPPMPDAARQGIVVTLIDAPVDPLGTMAVIGGIYTGTVARSKAEVTDEQRQSMLDDMQQTVLNGPLESISFTFLIEGVSRAITHQMVRNRFSFFAQESLRFAVAEDWAQEVPLPPSLAGLADDAPAVGVWRKALNASEDSYAALIGAGVPAEEARGLLPHAITTRLYWTVSLRTLLQEAGKRTCTQAQFDWRVLFSGIAKSFRDRSNNNEPYHVPGMFLEMGDGWQYLAFAELIRPVCYQDGKCGFMAKFDRGCTIRKRVDIFAINNIPSSEWGDARKHGPMVINPAEWAADPGAARVVE